MRQNLGVGGTSANLKYENQTKRLKTENKNN